MDVHMWKLTLDSRAVAKFAREQGLLHRETDHGYVIHAALAAVFGSGPSPFVLESALSPAALGRDVGRDSDSIGPTETVLAYSPQSLKAARVRASSDHRALVRWEDCDSKVMPVLSNGSRVAFATRVLPVVRSRAASPGRSEHGRGEGRELDAFLAECARVGHDVRVDRAAVYRGWLAQKLGGSDVAECGGAELEDFSLAAFRRVRLLRKGAASDGPRPRQVIERPDALVTGTLLIKDEAMFQKLILRGVGRHRAFGFGMLLLRRGDR